MTKAILPAFRERKFFYKNSEFLSGTFNQTDILVMTLPAPYNKANEFDVEELKSVHNSRCYMICFKEPYPAGPRTHIWIHKNLDLKGDKSFP